MARLPEQLESSAQDESSSLLGAWDDHEEEIFIGSECDDPAGDTDVDTADADATVHASGTQVGELSKRALFAVFCSLYIGRFMCALDGTVIVTLVIRISSEFNEFRSGPWVASSYLIALTACQPLFGKISDIYGRKSLLLFSNSVFAVGCILCGLAPNFWFLVFARVVAGIGGSGLNSLSVITLSDLVPLRQRGLLHGIGAVIYNSGAALGGVFGGLVADATDWRTAFLIQVPFVVISAIAIQINLKSEHGKKSETGKLKRVDFEGSITLVFGLSLLLVALSLAGNTLPWSHPLVSILFVLSFVVLSVFVHIETKIAKEPILPFALLKSPTILGSTLANAFIYMIMFSELFYIPIYLVAVKGFSATAAGMSVVSNFVGNAIGAIATGTYMRATGKYYQVIVLDTALLFVGCLLQCSVGVTTSIVTQVLYILVPGIASGSLMTATLVALIASVPHELQAVATSIQYGFRAIGSTLGVSIASAIFQNVLASCLLARVTGPGAEAIISRALESVDEIKRVPEEYAFVIEQSYLDACRGVFIFVAILALVNIGPCMLMKEHKLHNSIQRGH
ncbi:major facilitator superfamily domain-containing protein [Lipomyces kononenkoae]|uniref:Major facilitator superfamily domain-containing protein n=1 Tax=Lipomyces kononenkoae TaxID=34357 RepID=A0ACC3SRU2_LIPKO